MKVIKVKECISCPKVNSCKLVLDLKPEYRVALLTLQSCNGAILKDCPLEECNRELLQARVEELEATESTFNLNMAKMESRAIEAEKQLAMAREALETIAQLASRPCVVDKVRKVLEDIGGE